MRRYIPGAFAAVLLQAIGGPVNAQDVLVQKFMFNKIKHPNEIQFILTTITSDEFRAAASAIATAYGIPPNVIVTTIGVAEALRKAESKSGDELRGAFQSPPGYTICEAIWHNPSLNCGNTFNASYRRAKAGGGGLDGLHWYGVVRRPRPGQGRCWIDGVVEIRFVKAEQRARYPCQPYGICAWLEGPGGHGRNVPCGVPEEG